jgi:hypothetical protein
VFIWRGRCRGRVIHRDGQAGALPRWHAAVHREYRVALRREQTRRDLRAIA